MNNGRVSISTGAGFSSINGRSYLRRFGCGNKKAAIKNVKSYFRPVPRYPEFDFGCDCEKWYQGMFFPVAGGIFWRFLKCPVSTVLKTRSVLAAQDGGGIFFQTFKLVPYDKQGQNWGTSSRMTIKLGPIFGLGDRSNIFLEPPNRWVCHPPHYSWLVMIVESFWSSNQKGVLHPWKLT